MIVKLVNSNDDKNNGKVIINKPNFKWLPIK